MTQREYEIAYARARNNGVRITRGAMKEVKKVYRQAGKDVAYEIKRIRARNLADVTLKSKQRIEEQLTIGANNIRNKVGEKVPIAVRQGAESITRIDERYIDDIIEGVNDLTKSGITAVMSGVNERVVISTLNRMFDEQYTLSDRIWRVGNHYEDQINRVIGAGFAQGRDPVKIARDIEVYIADGKKKLVQRYGQLEAGTKEFTKRIGNSVDYRALRLIRSELYMSLQTAGVESGRANPGAEDLYDWILSPNRQHWGCECPSNQANGPYKYSNIPAYPHPNCQCRIQARLRDINEFKKDLKKWSNGETVDYIDDWHNEFYKPVA